MHRSWKHLKTDLLQSLDDSQFEKAMDSIRNFELQEMNYNIDFCKICNERRIDMKMSIDDICKRCATDKSQIKQFSTENNMNPGILPKELSNLSILEQLICRISPCINVHLLKHGVIGSSGHCVTFPQDINQPAQIFPRLPKEISIIRVGKQGKNDTSKEFRVRRQTIENALLWLENNNPAYSDIYISQDRLLTIPIDGELQNIETLDDNLLKENGPAPEQLIDTDIVTGETHSTMMLPDTVCNISEKVKNVVKDVMGENNSDVIKSKRGIFTIPWPTRDNQPVSEFTTVNFFTLAFPTLFPYATGDFHINRPKPVTMTDWAEHLMWFSDGRFAQYPYFKFVLHNMIARKRAIDQGNYIVRQQLGDPHLTVADLKQKLQEGDTS